jgi:hypothetical protein
MPGAEARISTRTNDYPLWEPPGAHRAPQPRESQSDSMTFIAIHCGGKFQSYSMNLHRYSMTFIAIHCGGVQLNAPTMNSTGNQ